MVTSVFSLPGSVLPMRRLSHLSTRGPVRGAERARVACQLEEPGASFRATPRPKKSARLEPSFYLSREDAVELQLKALQNNNFPYTDHGIEVLYRFAAFNPFERSCYFGGKSLDLGQWERFRRIVYTPCYFPLVNHTAHQTLSTLEVSEHTWIARVLVTKEICFSKEEHVYEFTMTQRFGGKRDGYWFCDRITCDGCDHNTFYGVI